MFLRFPLLHESWVRSFCWCRLMLHVVVDCNDHLYFVSDDLQHHGLPMDMVRSSVIPLGGTCKSTTASLISLCCCCNDRSQSAEADSTVSLVNPGGSKLRVVTFVVLQDAAAAAGGEQLFVPRELNGERESSVVVVVSNCWSCCCCCCMRFWSPQESWSVLDCAPAASSAFQNLPASNEVSILVAAQGRRIAAAGCGSYSGGPPAEKRDLFDSTPWSPSAFSKLPTLICKQWQAAPTNSRDH